MAMYYRLFWLFSLIFWLEQAKCQEGRVQIENNYKNNKIDLHISEQSVQSSNAILNISSSTLNLEINSQNSNHKNNKKLGERYPSGDNDDLAAATQFLQDNDKESNEMTRITNLANWNFDANLTEYNKQLMLEANLKNAKFELETHKKASSFAWKLFNDTLIKRWFKRLTSFNDLAIGETKYKEINLINADIVDIYSKAKVCDFKSNNCNLELEPDLNSLLKNSRDYDELRHVFVEWRNKTGRLMRSKYIRYAELMNEVANKNGFNDIGEYWREDFEDEMFEENLRKELKKIQFLYKLLHAYVRKQLRSFYGPERIQPDGPIPMHILGNMWAQDWSQSNLEILLPFPNCAKTSVTKSLQEKNATAKDIFKMSESFFKSLGLEPMTKEFWENSIIEKPTDREIVCHASAWDFSDGKDFRIKQCTRIELEDLITVHHEMGHIQYFMQYRSQPNVFRNGANSGFHESIGDTVALSVSTPTHLKKIGLTEDQDSNDNKICTEEKKELNFLMEMALAKVAFLPFGFVIDKWRWDLFANKISEKNLNTHWWKLRAEYEGLCPPVKRTENDFDPGSKYHVPANVPYIRYFVSHILQFQFHKYLCDASGYTGPLHKCDIYNSKKAGQQLKATLELGSSLPWTEALRVISNNKETKLNADLLLSYFKPLSDWLEKELVGEKIGWKINDPTVCPGH